jgi:multiple sugar transport system permease protein
MASYRNAHVAKKIAIWAGTVLLLLFVLGPILWMVDSSFQGEVALTSRPSQLVPQQPTVANYLYIFTGKIPRSSGVNGAGPSSRVSQEAREVLHAMKNSSLVAGAVMLINLVLGALAAYSFARFRFKGRETIFNFLLGSRLLPVIAIAIPYYLIIKTLNLLDTYTGLILVYLTLTLPFTVWFLRRYFEGIPREVEEAALVDGCTPMRALLRVVLPISASGLAASAAFAFMTSYNEFLLALLLTETIRSQTLPVILASVATNPDASLALTATCVTLAMVPPALIATVLARYMTRGVATMAGYSQ